MSSRKYCPFQRWLSTSFMIHIKRLQVNKKNMKLKVKEGATGITRSENSRTQLFLVAPILQFISEERYEFVGVSSTTPTKHLKLRQAYTTRQNNRVSFLAFRKQKKVPMRNIITGQIFSNEICDDMLNCESRGIQLYK